MKNRGSRDTPINTKELLVDLHPLSLTRSQEVSLGTLSLVSRGVVRFEPSELMRETFPGFGAGTFTREDHGGYRFTPRVPTAPATIYIQGLVREGATRRGQFSAHFTYGNHAVLVVDIGRGVGNQVEIYGMSPLQWRELELWLRRAFRETVFDENVMSFTFPEGRYADEVGRTSLLRRLAMILHGTPEYVPVPGTSGQYYIGDGVLGWHVDLCDGERNMLEITLVSGDDMSPRLLGLQDVLTYFLGLEQYN